jgi:hypothetical protein
MWKERLQSDILNEVRENFYRQSEIKFVFYKLINDYLNPLHLFNVPLIQEFLKLNQYDHADLISIFGNARFLNPQSVAELKRNPQVGESLGKLIYFLFKKIGGAELTPYVSSAFEFALQSNLLLEILTKVDELNLINSVGRSRGSFEKRFSIIDFIFKNVGELEIINAVLDIYIKNTVPDLKISDESKNEKIELNWGSESHPQAEIIKEFSIFFPPEAAPRLLAAFEIFFNDYRNASQTVIQNAIKLPNVIDKIILDYAYGTLFSKKTTDIDINAKTPSTPKDNDSTALSTTKNKKTKPS